MHKNIAEDKEKLKEKLQSNEEAINSLSESEEGKETLVDIVTTVSESTSYIEEMLSSGLDIVVVARNTVAGVGYHDINSAFLHLCKLHKILKWI